MDQSHLVWAAAVARALGDLESTDRAALCLIYGQGMTQARAARQLRLPESLIHECVARGLRELANRLSSTESVPIENR